MKCPICGADVINDTCARFPVCNYRLKSISKDVDRDMVLFDIETTGLNKLEDRIIEIGAIKIHDGKITDRFSLLCNPGKDSYGNQIFISSRITEITGITNAMVDGQQDEKTAMLQFVEWLGDTKVLAGQNIVSFDVPFIKAAAKRAGTKIECKEALDTLIIARNCKLKERGFVKNYKQPTLAEYYGFTYNAHRAVDDADACFRIYQLLKEEAKDYGVLVIPEKI